jgi:hypothetical protein
MLPANNNKADGFYLWSAGRPENRHEEIVDQEGEVDSAH